MPTEQIVALLVSERDRLSRAIEALQGPTKRRGRPPKSADRIVAGDAVNGVKAPAAKRELSAAGRKAIADAARRRWAAIKAGKAPSPFATAKRKK
jgi:hypothetical protein